MYKDFANSGIHKDITDKYINKCLLIPNDNGWKGLFYSLEKEVKTVGVVNSTRVIKYLDVDKFN